MDRSCVFPADRGGPGRGEYHSQARRGDFFCGQESPGGSDSNSGTESAPWRTIQKAANTAVTGDTVYIKEGVYSERVTFANSARRRVLSPSWPTRPFCGSGWRRQFRLAWADQHSRKRLHPGRGLEIRNNTVGWGCSSNTRKGTSTMPQRTLPLRSGCPSYGRRGHTGAGKRQRRSD